MEQNRLILICSEEYKTRLPQLVKGCPGPSWNCVVRVAAIEESKIRQAADVDAKVRNIWFSDHHVHQEPAAECPETPVTSQEEAIEESAVAKKLNTYQMLNMNSSLRSWALTEQTNLNLLRGVQESPPLRE
uniref:Levopimaradiene synthase, chloroplastic n=1 Tax=Lygus hesperus TaxID=30085 RepID=A0A0A9ZF00_LYGHE